MNKEEFSPFHKEEFPDISQQVVKKKNQEWADFKMYFGLGLIFLAIAFTIWYLVNDL